jgi:hypothetical protein
MATASEFVVEQAEADSAQTITSFIDRWIWTFMAGLFLVTVLVGFVPDSFTKIAAVQAGQRPGFPPILHVHAVLTGSWILLLLAQTSLMATGKHAWHMKLGLLSMLLAPAIVIAGTILIPTRYLLLWDFVHAAPPGEQASLSNALIFPAKILMFQIRTGILFSLFVLLALRARRRDSGMHKRLMILATALPMPAAVDRILWLPTTMPLNPISQDLYMLLLVSPMFLWDLYRLGHVHRAYLLWVTAILPFTVAFQFLWNSPSWQAFVARLMGVG